MITVTSNVAEFQATLRQAIAASSRTITQVILSHAYQVMRHTINSTRRADRSDIEALGVVGYEVQLKKRGKGYRMKGGQIKRGAAILEDRSRARAIVVSKLRASGKLKGSSTEDILKRSRMLITSKIKSIGYLAAGWLPAMRRIASRAGIPFRRTGEVLTWGKPIGSVEFNLESWSPSITCVNANPDMNQPRAYGFAEQGLMIGIQKETAEMKRHLASKIAKEFTSRGAKASL
jgi:hypothetical protein